MISVSSLGRLARTVATSFSKRGAKGSSTGRGFAGCTDALCAVAMIDYRLCPQMRHLETVGFKRHPSHFSQLHHKRRAFLHAKMKYAGSHPREACKAQ